MHMTKWKKPVFTGYILYDSDSMIFWRRQNHEDRKKLAIARNWEGGMSRWDFGVLKLFCVIRGYMLLSICQNPQIMSSTVNSRANYGLGHQWPAPVGLLTVAGNSISSRRGQTHVSTGSRWENLQCLLRFSVTQNCSKNM